MIPLKRHKGLYIPPGVVGINRSHPAAAYLTGAWVMNQRTARLVEATGKRARCTTGGSPTHNNGTIGGYVGFNNSNSVITTNFLPSGACSFIAVVMRTTDTVTDVTYGQVQEIMATGGSTGLDINIGNGYGPVGDKNKPRLVSQSSFVETGTNKAWIDGRKQSSNNPCDVALVNGKWYCIGGTFSALTTGTENLKFGLLGASGAGLIGGIALVLSFSAVLSDNIMTQLTTDPTSILKFQRESMSSQRVGIGSILAYNNSIWFGSDF